MVKKVEPPRKQEKTNVKENIGKVLINLGQLLFGTLFLGSVLRGELPQYIMMVTGFIGALALLSFGIVLSTKKQKDKEE